MAQLVKNLPAMQKASTPGLGRSPGEGKGYPLQYPGLENSMDYIVHGVAKSRTWLSNWTTTPLLLLLSLTSCFSFCLFSIVHAEDVLEMSDSRICGSSKKLIKSFLFKRSLLLRALRCNMVGLHCKLVGPRCEAVGPRCEVVGSRCEVVGSCCEVVGPLCEVVGPRCEVVGPAVRWWGLAVRWWGLAVRSWNGK